MGLFKKIKKKTKKIFKKVGSSAPKIGLTVASGGTNLLLEQIPGGKGITETFEKALFPTGLSDVVETAQFATAVLSGQPQPGGPTGGQPMAGNILGGIGGLLGQLGGFGGTVGAVAGLGSSFLSGFLPAGGPKLQQMQAFPQAQPVMAGVPAIAAAGAAAMTAARAILAKLSQLYGKNITLRAAMIIIRRLGKTLVGPVAVATAMGLTIGELGILLTENAIQGSSGRRMNIGNVKALRRAHRRIRGFHKLCGDNDQLRSPRRRTAPRKTILVNAKTCA